MQQTLPGHAVRKVLPRLSGLHSSMTTLQTDDTEDVQLNNAKQWDFNWTETERGMHLAKTGKLTSVDNQPQGSCS